MKTITKIIGYIGLSAALWHVPHGQAITLQQINAFQEACRKESIQNLKALLEQEKKRLDPSIRATNTEYIQKFLENYSSKNVYYDGNGDFVIETVNLNSPSFKLFPFLTYEKQNWNNWNKEQEIDPLDAISKELSADALKQRGVDINELKGKGINKVREITFDSILKNPFFTKEQRRKGEEWSRDLNALEAAVEDYAKGCVPLYKKDGKFKISQRNTRIYTDNKGCIQSTKEQDLDRFVGDALWLPASVMLKQKTWLPAPVILKQKTQSCLKRMLNFKNGKEKVILFLLLDEKTTPKVSWVWDGRKGESSAFDQMNNAFLCNPDDIEWSLSHEIGHYLQTHLGLRQTFNDYQNSFAQELLLLENNLSNDMMFKIPTCIQEKVSQFDGTSRQETLSAKACFEYCQLIARWLLADEISNILGVYFRDDTLYINALSDIRELKRVRYGNNSKIGGKAITKSCALLEDTKIRQAFTSICNEAFGRTVPTEALRLLCQLHGRASEDAENVVCEFDYDGQGYAEKVEPAFMDFIETEQP